MPTLFLFAGPNGAGKTSLARDRLPGETPPISPDDIAHNEALTPASKQKDSDIGG